MIKRLDAFLERPALPWALGFLTACLVLAYWGSLAPPAVIHDERAYLVQARLLAGGSWTAATPPLPIFWEMAHLFVEPAIFAKYPPGHAPLLVPGIWLGVPALLPLVMAGVAAGFLFALARHVSGAWGALATWALWTTAPTVLSWQATYLSEITTAALWPVALWLLLIWQRRPRAWPLAALTAAVGWMGLTRPVTAIALALPIAAVVLLVAWRRRALHGWPAAACVAIAILGFLPWWNARTMGDATVLPYERYSTIYFPFDKPGFDRDDSPPLRELPPDLRALGQDIRAIYVGHDRSSIVPNLVSRTRSAAMAGFPDDVRWLALLAPVGLLAMGSGLASFLAASALGVIVLYLSMPHHPKWDVYYLEVFPVGPLLAVAALAWLSAQVVRLRRHTADVLAEDSLMPTQGPRLRLPRALALVIVAFVAVRAVPALPMDRVDRDVFAKRLLVLEAMIDRLPERRVVIFARPNPHIPPHYTVHDILGDPATTDRWIVRDLGEQRNAELIARAGDRAPYVFVEREQALVRVGRDARPESP